MNLDQKFSRIAFYQVLLGILTFCYAEANPGMLLVAGSLVVLSRYLSEGPWGRPLPWWIIHLLALLSLAWMTSRILWADPNIIVAMGHFTMSLQVLVMFARKGNREYGQVLMLSLLQMIGASVLSVSMIYGALLWVYCVLALLTVLIFHLKSNTDRVYEANRAAAADQRRVMRPKQIVGRGFRWQFSAVVVVLLIGAAMVAVSVFILTPRSPQTPLAGDRDGPLGPRQVGFSQQVHLDGPPIAQGSKEPVMNVRIDFPDTQETFPPWLLRGAALDVYDPFTHTWKRSQEASSTDNQIAVESFGLTLADAPPAEPMWHARVTLRQIGHRHLFTVLPVTSFSSDGISSVIYSGEDQQLSAGTPVKGAVIYDIRWPRLRQGNTTPRYRSRHEINWLPRLFGSAPLESRFLPQRYARGWAVQQDQIASFTRDILSEAGLARDEASAYGPDDRRIAEVLAEYLRENYTYRLSGQRNRRGAEPIIEFLFRHRMGHCELFASSLAAMTRSIGMQARVVTGFRAAEFNQIGGYYVVRQSDAHAWVEVNHGPGMGWHSYDATPSDEMTRLDQAQRGWHTVIREAYEHLEFGWIRSIVAYDVGTRRAVLVEILDSIKSVLASEENWLGQFIQFMKNLPMAWELDKVNTSKVVGSAVLALIIGGALIRAVLLRRRRMAYLKLTGLPADRQLELAWQLSFYLEMIRILSRYGYDRHVSQNPRDFAESLVVQKPEVMAPVLALTDLFYRIRFGGETLDSAQRRSVQAELGQLQQSLAAANRA